MNTAPVTQRDGSTVLVEMAPAPTVAYAVDLAGQYLGRVVCGANALQVSGPPPPGDGWRWSGSGWVRTVPLDELREQAEKDIDAAAGEARLRYLTDVPGQEVVYLRKMQEADEYLAAVALDPLANVPPYIAAEAAATGATAVQAAQSIAEAAALWDAVLSPAIEGARIAGKRAVNAAADAAGVQAALADALPAIQGI